MAFRGVMGKARTVLLQDYLQMTQKIGLLARGCICSCQIHRAFYCSSSSTTTSFPGSLIVQDGDYLRAQKKKLPIWVAPENLGAIIDTEGADKNEKYINLARYATNKHNEDKNENLQFVRVVEAQRQRVCGKKYFIKLEAINDGKPMIYYAVVWEKVWLNFKELLDWKLVDDGSSTVDNKQDFEGSKDCKVFSDLGKMT